MSTITHLFNVNIEATEHFIISTSPNLIITAESAAGEANTFMGSKWGEYNHVKGFETGVDKIKIPLDAIKEVYPSTTIVKGPLHPGNFNDDSNYDAIMYDGDKLFYASPGQVGSGESGPTVTVIMLDKANGSSVSVAAGDIEIV